MKSQKMSVQKADRKEIEAFLKKDLTWSSEVIFTLEEEAEEVAAWYVFKEGEAVKTAMMLCPVYRPVPIFLAGKVLGASYLLEKAERHKSIFIECPLDFVGLVKKNYFFSSTRIMVRMVLKRKIPYIGRPDRKPRKLMQDDLKGVFDLYERTAALGNVSGFDAMQFIRGLYYGIEIDGRIVSMAGTQTISPQYGTATVGNVITDDDYRENGYAMACTYSLAEELRKDYACITINVNRGHKAGIHIYRRCGFVKQLEYFEGEGNRKEI